MQSQEEAHLSTVPIRRELLAWLVALTLVVTQIVTLRSQSADAGVFMVAGPETQVVYIATGENFPDALGAAAAAGAGLAPVLLVQQNVIPQPTLDELNRLEPRRVVIVGGLAVISQAVENQLDALAFNPFVQRLSGANRYATAAELSEATFPTSGKFPRVAFAVSDGLGAGPAGTVQTLFSVAIDAPDNGILVIDAGADIFTVGGAVITCWISLNTEGNQLEGSFRSTAIDVGESDDCSTQVSVTVPLGEHEVLFRVNQDAATTIGEGSITVQWMPFGAFGELPNPAG